MQILKELPDGQRIRVSYEEYDKDRMGLEKHKLVYYMRTNSAVIYHMNGTKHKTPRIPNYKFGGRGRGQNTGHSVWHGA